MPTKLDAKPLAKRLAEPSKMTPALARNIAANVLHELDNNPEADADEVQDRHLRWHEFSPDDTRAVRAVTRALAKLEAEPVILKVDRSRLLSALRAAGLAIPEHGVNVTVSVPSGGDWSSCELDIEGNTMITVRFSRFNLTHSQRGG